MKRIQLFEFEDFTWLPKPIRTGMTNLIVVFHKMTGTSAVIAGLIEKVRSEHPFKQMVDLGSGSGGAMPEVVRQLNESTEEQPVHLILTDLHPHPDLVARFNKNGGDRISYHPESVDATSLRGELPGLRTMMNSFHHMPENKARAILRSAQESKQPMLIYEMAENNIPTWIWWLFLPISLSILIIMTLFMTPFVRPLSWQQLVFTYLIPVIPILYAWDGQASLVRMYTFKDVEELLKDLKQDDYRWEMGQAKKANGKKQGYYILGIPKR
jgi:hypothetical protein